MTSRSKELFEKAKACIPGGVNSPVRAFKHIGDSPIYFRSAEGPYLYDVDGNSYVDFCMAFGPHLFGHSDPDISRAIQEQAIKGTSFGACHQREIQVSRLLLKGYPFCDQVRLMSSGTEAVMTGLRVARAKTKKDKILKFEGCYHGHLDSLLVSSGSGMAMLSKSASDGVPPSLIEDTWVARYDNLDETLKLIENHHEKIAALIVEPIPANYGLWVPPLPHLRAIVETARKRNIAVIFDEVITGFRLGVSGASGYFDLQPDLVTLGKVIGGGLPLSALLGKAEFLNHLAPQGETYQAGTFSGNILSCVAAYTALQKVFDLNPYRDLERSTQAFTKELERKLQSIADVSVRSIGSIFWFDFGNGSFPPVISEKAMGSFKNIFNLGLERGVYFSPSPFEVCFLSVAHSPDVLEHVLKRFDRV